MERPPRSIAEPRPRPAGRGEIGGERSPLGLAEKVGRAERPRSARWRAAYTMVIEAIFAPLPSVAMLIEPIAEPAHGLSSPSPWAWALTIK